MPKMKKKKKKKKRPRRKIKQRDLRVQMVPISDLKFWEKNPRVNDEAAEKLAILIKRHGFIVPVIATQDGTIRAGHTRIKGAMIAGYTKVPTIYVDFGSEEEAEIFSLSDNRSQEWAEWDPGMLRDLFVELEEVVGQDVLEGTGFTQLEIEGMSSEMIGLAAQSFAEMVEEFAEQHPDEEVKEPWIWMILPNKKILERLLKRYASREEGTTRRRELDWAKVRPRLLPRKKKRGKERERQ